MGNRPHYYSTAVLTNAAESANNTETVVATLAGVTAEYSNQIVKLRAWFKGTTGTGTTAGLLRLRRASLTGTAVGEGTAETLAFVASKTTEGVVNAEDSPGELAGGIYVLTYTGTGDTGVCNFLAASIEARID